MKHIKQMTVLLLFVAFAGCAKIDEKFSDSLVRSSASSVTAADILKNIYEGDIRNFMNQDNLWAIQEHTTDECVGPTRGGDWDDNGIWRVLHQHTWDANHNYVRGAFENLGRVVYNATEVLGKSPNAQQDAEARFLRAYANFHLVEGWNQVPYREPGGDPLAIPEVRVGTEALEYVITELEAIKAALPDGPVNVANKNACRALLMKAYLTKAVVANRTTPVHQAADMNKVIALADEVIASGKTLSTNFYHNFAPNNDALSTENLFTGINYGGSSSGGVRSRYFCSLHYNQTPSGWNGFTTLSDFYDSFEDADVRKSTTLPGFTDQVGTKAGFNVGQVRGPQGQRIGNPLVDLKDRSNNPLVFTRNVSIFFNGEASGIRTNKFPLNPSTINDGGWGSANDFVFLRVSDVRLMKAEAALRGGTSAETPLAIVNDIRTKRSASVLASVTLNTLIAERGRELYLEGWRRNDMIRFGIFNSPVQERPNASEGYKVVFPLPNIALSSNPNLKQNFGY